MSKSFIAIYTLKLIISLAAEDGLFFFKFTLLHKINANVDSPAGEYKGRFCFSNHLCEMRFGLNPQGKASLQQDSQEPGRKTFPNLYPALSEVILKK